MGDGKPKNESRVFDEGIKEGGESPLPLLSSLRPAMLF